MGGSRVGVRFGEVTTGKRSRHAVACACIRWSLQAGSAPARRILIKVTPISASDERWDAPQSAKSFAVWFPIALRHRRRDATEIL